MGTDSYQFRGKLVNEIRYLSINITYNFSHD